MRECSVFVWWQALGTVTTLLVCMAVGLIVLLSQRICKEHFCNSVCSILLLLVCLKTPWIVMLCQILILVNVCRVFCRCPHDSITWADCRGHIACGVVSVVVEPTLKRHEDDRCNINNVLNIMSILLLIKKPLRSEQSKLLCLQLAVWWGRSIKCTVFGVSQHQ